MPTIIFSLGDLQNLVGKKITLKEIGEIAEYCKGEFENYNKETDEVTLSLDDTNLPYLWSVEGIARLIRGAYDIETGIPKLEIKKASYSIIVDKSVFSVRPYIAALVARKKKIDEYLLKQLIQLQEKFCEGYGRRRQKASIGLYSFKRIIFPVHYKAVAPASAGLIPLEFSKKLNLNQILKEHPKGREYSWILKGKKLYPLLVDSKNEVLSFPPIINSNFTGKIEVNDADLLMEVTGEDEDTVNLAVNIFAQALYERGFDVYSVDIKYPERKITTPFSFNESIKIKEEDVEKLLGLKLKNQEIRKLLEKARYGFDGFEIKVPDYRRDIMHPFDVIEDIAIMYGFHNIKDAPLESYTTGETLPMIKFSDMFRELLAGAGYQEIMSQILSNKKSLYERMSAKDFGTVEIKNQMSESYSAVRTWLLPMLMEVLSKNKHVDYPQKIFEQGLVTVNNRKIADCEKLAAASSHSGANFTEIRQLVDYIFRVMHIDYSVEELGHSSFIAGRAAKIIVMGEEVGFFGELSPEVLEKWNLEMPVAAFEINLSEIFELQK